MAAPTPKQGERSPSKSPPKRTTRTRSKIGSEKQTCSVAYCTNNSEENPRIHFFNFPTEEERCLVWVQKTKNTDLEDTNLSDLSKTFAICNEHFEDEMFVNAKQKQRLKGDAVPTIFDGGSSEIILDEKNSSKESPEKTTTRKRKRQQKGTIEKSDMPKIQNSPLTCHAMRINPGEDFKDSLSSYIAKHNLQAAFILSCVGSVKEAEIRTANSVNVIHVTTPHEILSLSGTLSESPGHLHISLSDEEGKVIGGHLKSAVIHTTAEVVIGELPKLFFKRLHDDKTGFTELVVEPRKGAESDGNESQNEEKEPSSGVKRGRKKETKSTVKLVSSESGTPTISVNDTLLNITHL